MKKIVHILVILALLTGAYLAGSTFGKHGTGMRASSGDRKILYYVDPMNPTHTSEKPGLAPCGMKLEPVYADESGGQGAGSITAMLPGTVKITSEKQQLVGVRTAQVEEIALSHVIRTTGRVAPDEMRLFVINATVSGWITGVMPSTTGSLVKTNETLATFYSPEFLSAGQALLFGLNTLDRAQATGLESSPQKNTISQLDIRLQQFKDSLRNLGMGDLQVEEMMRDRKYIQNVNITSPGDGFVLYRNVSYGLRFNKGDLMYKVADLSHVWILADLFENEAQYALPGVTVRVTLPHRNKVFQALVSDIAPQFNAATRTLTVRLEVDNPNFILWPDMFVDVEFPISLPRALVIPVDAILDSGLRKTVFVDRGNGFFEPREVETGWRAEGHVQIVKGLMPGERIVVSGNFLIDSESRMKLAAQGLFGALSSDPVCGVTVAEAKAEADGLIGNYQGKSYYFCSEECKGQFEQNPVNYLQGPHWKGGSRTAGNEPECGPVRDEIAARVAGLMSEYLGRTYYFGAKECKELFERDPGKYLQDRPGVRMTASVPNLESARLVRDPVCSMVLVEGRAKTSGRQVVYEGSTYSFCSDYCKGEFQKDPDRFLKKPPPGNEPTVNAPPANAPAVNAPAANAPTADAPAGPIWADGPVEEIRP